MIQEFDKINGLYASDAYASVSGIYDDHVDYEEYFDVMDIPDEQKQKRIEASRKIRNDVMFLFSLFLIAYSMKRATRGYLLSRFEPRYRRTVGGIITPDAYIDSYIWIAGDNIINGTINNAPKESPEDSYWVSDKRADIISVNEANSICNYAQLEEAKARGFQSKTWNDMQDKRVREAHEIVGGTRIPIDEYFSVGNDLMLMPHDEVNGSAENLVNCRCWLTFS